MEFEDDIDYEDICLFTERNISNLEWIEKDDVIILLRTYSK